jgi:hypothetical protein
MKNESWNSWGYFDIGICCFYLCCCVYDKGVI